MELNVLEKIERDLIEKYSEKGDIILMGDFNARTGSEEDLIISDDTSHVPLSDNQYVIDTAVGKRSSHDSHIIYFIF
jgi:endonuclease/exonuclease/phosphatase family metal-dependent hydrolase